MVPDRTVRRVLSGAAVLACDVVGDGPPIVFLHAGVADRRSWWAAISILKEGYRCVSYDRRGFGETAYEPEAHSQVDDLLAVLRELGAERVVLVGNSQGGRIAIDFALAHPDRVSALLLVAPAISGQVWPDLDSGATLNLIRAAAAANEVGDNDRVNSLEAHLWLDGPKSKEGRVAGNARALFLNMNGRALSAAPVGDEYEPPSAADRLAELSMPVHVILGGLDLAVISEIGHSLSEAVPFGSATIFDKAAHLPQLEDPSGFAADLRRFLGRVVLP